MMNGMAEWLQWTSGVYTVGASVYAICRLHRISRAPLPAHITCSLCIGIRCSSKGLQ